MIITNKEYTKRIRAWIKDLRSGNFKQSRMCYHGRNGGHCCLGVAQITAGLPEEESGSRMLRHYGISLDEANNLIDLNDKGHRNFAYIADRIEKKILPRFLTK